MKQILQSLRTGVTEVADVPSPGPARGQLLIRTTRSLLSSGTERVAVDFGKAGFLGKALQQPERVRQVLDKVRSDGLAPTLEAVFNKLDQPLPLGYCNVGTVLATGAGVTDFAEGDRVVSNGRHAEIVAAPVNLCARIPDAVTDDAAAFAVVGAIALQGMRLVAPTLGEAVVVTGLGLIGLMAVQLLRANGCRVLGIDLDPARLKLAAAFGAETVDLSGGQDPVSAALAFSRGRGVDAVIITASTRSNEPVHQAAQMCRKRGRIVLVGVTGLELSRADFYEKELTFQVSCSYGPGRYDPAYEEGGNDYPVAFVRWTEQRNFEAVLDMMADGRLDVSALISHRYAIENASAAYEIVAGAEPSLGIVLEYPSSATVDAEVLTRRVVSLLPASERPPGSPGVAVGVIGAGNYGTAVLIPAMKAAGARLVEVVSNGGVSGLHAARKFGFERAGTDVEMVFADEQINAVVVATRHDSHADLVCRALEADKHVFVEKPLAISHAELTRIEAAYASAIDRGFQPLVMVGFNRRFAPHVSAIRDLLSATPGPKAFVVTVNAGAIPPDHWTHDRNQGGGRILGEACHFVDLLRFLADAPVASHDIRMMAGGSGDTASILLTFDDGSLGTIHYLANGSRAFPKERLEVFADGRILQLDNFRRLRGFGWPGFSRLDRWRQDKGQVACATAFVRAIEQGTAPPIAFAELMEVSRVSIDLAG